MMITENISFGSRSEECKYQVFACGGGVESIAPSAEHLHEDNERDESFDGNLISENDLREMHTQSIDFNQQKRIR